MAVETLQAVLSIDWRLFVPRRKFTKAEYYRMAEMGFFEGQRVELIDGEVVLMSPQEAEHATAVELVAEILRHVFTGRFHVRDQKPLDLGEGYEPEPDIAVVEGSPRDYSSTHPKSAALVAEVALTSLDYDRTVKSSLYARAGIPEYWVLNLRDRRLEVFREPFPQPETPFGYGYRHLTVFLPDDEVAPLCKPEAKVKVTDLLP